eukprot:6228445-Amphidinium_carterae.1
MFGAKKLTQRLTECDDTLFIAASSYKFQRMFESFKLEDRPPQQPSHVVYKGNILCERAIVHEFCWIACALCSKVAAGGGGGGGLPVLLVSVTFLPASEQRSPNGRMRTPLASARPQLPKRPAWSPTGRAEN